MSTGIIKYKDIDINKIEFTKLEDNEWVLTQKIGYVRYKVEQNKNIQFKIQSPEYLFESGGFPREGPNYPDAKSRSFFKYTFCHERHKYDDCNYDEQEILYNKLKELDTLYDTDEYRKQIFGDKFNQYAYQPFIRTSDLDEEINEKYKNIYKPPYIKLRIDLKYSKDSDNQSTQPLISIIEKKNDIREKHNITSFEELVEFIKFKSKLKFIISFSKLYAMKTKSGNEKKKYGIILKLTHVEIQRPNNHISNNLDDPFADDDNLFNTEHINEELINDELINENERERERVDSDEVKVHKLDVSDDSDEDEEEVEDIKEIKKKSK